MNLSIGTRVRWESAAGVKRGTIKNIVLAPAADKSITPWIDVQLDATMVREVAPCHLQNYMIRLCASDSNLKMMRVSEVTA
jgi:hypothetical protein